MSAVVTWKEQTENNQKREQPKEKHAEEHEHEYSGRCVKVFSPRNGEEKHKKTSYDAVAVLVYFGKQILDGRNGAAVQRGVCLHAILHAGQHRYQSTQVVRPFLRGSLPQQGLQFNGGIVFLGPLLPPHHAKFNVGCLPHRRRVQRFYTAVQLSFSNHPSVGGTTSKQGLNTNDGGGFVIGALKSHRRGFHTFIVPGLGVQFTGVRLGGVPLLFLCMIVVVVHIAVPVVDGLPPFTVRKGAGVPHDAIAVDHRLAVVQIIGGRRRRGFVIDVLAVLVPIPQFFVGGGSHGRGVRGVHGIRVCVVDRQFVLPFRSGMVEIVGVVVVVVRDFPLRRGWRTTVVVLLRLLLLVAWRRWRRTAIAVPLFFLGVLLRLLFVVLILAVRVPVTDVVLLLGRVLFVGHVCWLNRCTWRKEASGWFVRRFSIAIAVG